MSNAIIDIVHGALGEWNHQCEKTNQGFYFDLKGGVRVKKYYINKNDFYEREIAELRLLQIATDTKHKNISLYHYEVPVPAKEKFMKRDETIRTLNEHLYRNLMYEMVGTFTLNCQQLILNQDYHEYDIENDRIKQHESADGMVVKALVNGPYYNVGEEFDVFIDWEGDNYGVYTEHEFGKANNGVARMPKKDCLVSQAAKKKIILLSDLK